MGIWVSEIQKLTASRTWYVDTVPSDNLTHGKTLAELAASNRWIQGPAFLRRQPNEWPSRPSTTEQEDSREFKQSVFCAFTQANSPLKIPDIIQFSSWRELVKGTQQSLHGAVADPASPVCSSPFAEGQPSMLLLRGSQIPQRG